MQSIYHTAKLYIIAKHAAPCSLREPHRHSRADAGGAFEPDAATVILHGVLDDGQPQPRAAGGLRAALGDAVKPLEHMLRMLRRDAPFGEFHGRPSLRTK